MRALQRRDVLLILLAIATGATDATAFERLGHVFASVITGNLVVLGVSAPLGDGRLALMAGCALGGYAVGVFVAAPRPGPGHEEHDRDWPSGVSAALAFELALMVVFAAGWWLADGRPGHTAQTLLAALGGAAMGVQSTAVRRLGQISTTYLTSTLTGLVEGLAARRRPEGDARSVGILLSAVAGAAAGTALIQNAEALLPALQLIPLAVVIVAGRRLHGARG